MASADSIVVLATPSDVTNIVVNALRREHSNLTLVLEERVSRWQLVKGRYRRLGLLPVIGQLAFIGIVPRALRRRSRDRVHEIAKKHGLDDSEPSCPVHRVSSVNTDETRALLGRLSPRVVVVFGTRIIGRTTLRAVNAPFINVHAGITPRYRGVHGGYWALAEGRADLVGTTVHLVDEGIDTGTVIEQVRFIPTARDNFATYPYLHLAAGLPALQRAVGAALSGELRTTNGPEEPSRLRYHPTLLEYVRFRVP
jgi:methionyl-tRNA formyltransferase